MTQQVYCIMLVVLSALGGGRCGQFLGLFMLLNLYYDL